MTGQTYRFQQPSGLKAGGGPKHVVDHIAITIRERRKRFLLINDEKCYNLCISSSVAGRFSVPSCGLPYQRVPANYTDEVFGEDNMLNRIMALSERRKGKKHFSRKHDTILFTEIIPHYFNPEAVGIPRGRAGAII